MNCPLHVNVTMKEKVERVPFAHMQNNESEPKSLWRVVARCPVAGCPQIQLVKTSFGATKKWKAPALESYI